MCLCIVCFYLMESNGTVMLTELFLSGKPGEVIPPSSEAVLESLFSVNTRGCRIDRKGSPVALPCII